MESLIFTRGFALACERLPHTPERFREIPLPSGHVFTHDDNLPAALVRRGDTFVLLAGYAIDLTNGNDDTESVAAHLLSALNAGHTEFLDRVDHIAGRHIIVFSDGASLLALTDATGMKTIFYEAARPGVICSHAELFAAPRSEPELPAAFGYPGIRTLYERVRVLTPNTLLNLHENTVVRFFPREPLATKTIEEAASVLCRTAAVQMEAITKRFPRVAISMTAGLDSRLTLALTRPWAQACEFFTYTHTGIAGETVDKVVATEIARRLGLRHSVFDRMTLHSNMSPEDASQFSAFEAMIKRNASLTTMPKLDFWFWKLHQEVDVHVRSTLVEIGRCFWRNLWGDTDTSLSPRRMAFLYNTSSLPKLTESGRVQAEAYFEEYITATSFDRLHGYDPYDMFYWEHRNGHWHARVCIENDPAFDTVVLFNARVILKAFLSIDFEGRRSAALPSHIVAKLLPELADIPVNPKEVPVYAAALT